MKSAYSKILGILIVTSIMSTWSATNVFAYIYDGYRWRGTSVSYHVNSAFASSFITAIQAADTTWDGAGSRFRFNYAGTTSRNPNVWASNYASGGSGGNDTYSDIGYYNNGATLVYAEGKKWQSGGYLVEVDTTLNTYYGFTTVGTAGYFDVQNIITHELGHWLHLVDLTSPGYPSFCGTAAESTVCSGTYAGETRKRSLETDDKNGIKAIYGT